MENLAMNDHQLRRIQIKKAQVLIDRKIVDAKRLEQIQMKVARGLPMFSENKVYLDSLILENLTEDEIKLIIQDVQSTELEKTELKKKELFYCVCCRQISSNHDGARMCGRCYLDYNAKISKFITRPMGGGPFF